MADAKKNPKNAKKPEDLLRRGVAEFRRGNYEHSQSLLEQAVAAAPDCAEAHAWHAAACGRLIEKAWSLPEKVEWLGKMEEAVSAAMALDPDLPLARRMRGAMLLYTPEMLGGDPEAAAADFRYCIEKGMREADVWVSLAECYIHMEDKPKALQALREALSVEPGHRRAKELTAKLQKNKG
mgnify:FL=1